MKKIFMTVTGLLGSLAVRLFGGWDTALQTLVLFMAFDWITGGILLPAVFKKSPKSKNGALESRAGWKGLCRLVQTVVQGDVIGMLDSTGSQVVCYQYSNRDESVYCLQQEEQRDDEQNIRGML